MYKHMNLWKIIDGWTFYNGYPLIKFFEPYTAKIMLEIFSSFTVGQARQTNKLLPLGHRWKGDIGIESEVNYEII
jgi:hypothetical protein